jgi:hypothetical protein
MKVLHNGIATPWIQPRVDALKISSELFRQDGHESCSRQFPGERRTLPGPLRAISRFVRSLCCGVVKCPRPTR